MAYEGFLALSDEDDLRHLEPVYVKTNSTGLVAAGEYTPRGIFTFLVDCSEEDEATVHITRLSRGNIRAIAEDPDVLIPILLNMTPSLGEISPDDSAARFPFRSGKYVHELALRHVERPMVATRQVGNLVLATASMN
jgi:hypothetical protein